jgi:photosystem II stability/assembly factor-like uncharacterized protein
MSGFSRLMKRLCKFCVAAVLALAPTAPAQVWQPMGPSGGDVRSLASDPANPEHLFLGTPDGHIFGSEDGGEHWTLLGRAGTRLDSVITSIIVDARADASATPVIWASAWTLDPTAGGGVYRSGDGGHTWRSAGLDGHAVRALAEVAWQPETLVAGAVDGAFRTDDAGQTWKRITPEGDAELRNFDSIAFDPANPRTIYAGTFHLPWKTTDGGDHWSPVHEGMIDDSDVMSLLVDRIHPRRVYASACSGIYLSEDGAAVWRKIQGIPYEARRTQVILQDPARAATVYAATTEGLWVTLNSGSTWRRLTPGDWVINSIAVIPGRIVIGTERLGILVSNDNGAHFHASNDGFYHREITALALDREHPGRVLAVLANAPEPLLATEDGGATWKPLGPGLRTQSLRRVYASPEGWWAALEQGGLMRYDSAKSVWVQAGKLTADGAAKMAPPPEERKTARPRSRARTPSAVPPSGFLAGRVNDMAFCHTAWFAATEKGLLTSTDQGATWDLLALGPLPTLPVQSIRVSSDGQSLRVVSLRGMVFSDDAGRTWSWHDLPAAAGAALWLDAALDDSSGGAEKTLVASAENGLYISRDAGATWDQVGSGLPEAPVQALAIAGSTFLASMRAGGLYLSRDRGRSWTRVPGTLAEGFFPVVTTEEQATTLFAASSTEGLYAVQSVGASAAKANSNAAKSAPPAKNQLHY